MVDRNDDRLIDPVEWKNFYNLFAVPYQNCVGKDTLLLSFEKFEKCLTDDETFSSMLTYNGKFFKAGDEKKFQKRVFNSLAIDNIEYVNFYGYLKLRNYNRIYKVLLDKEQEIYFENFPIAIHMLFEDV
jgi:hypothetical protein